MKNNRPLIPLHVLARRAHDAFMQLADKPRIPDYANFSILDLRFIRDIGAIDCRETPMLGLEDTLMGILRLRSRWSAWRGPLAKEIKREWDRHIAFGESLQELPSAARTPLLGSPTNASTAPSGAPTN